MKPVKNFHKALDEAGYLFYSGFHYSKLYIVPPSFVHGYMYTVSLQFPHKLMLLVFRINFDAETLRIEVAERGRGLHGLVIGTERFTRGDVETSLKFANKINEMIKKYEVHAAWN